MFSNEEVLSVSVRVDDNLGHWITCQHRSGPLYTATVDIQLEAWDPQISEKDFVTTLQVGSIFWGQNGVCYINFMFLILFVHVRVGD